jgi:hypothetical protein
MSLAPGQNLRLDAAIDYGVRRLQTRNRRNLFLRAPSRRRRSSKRRSIAPCPHASDWTSCASPLRKDRRTKSQRSGLVIVARRLVRRQLFGIDLCGLGWQPHDPHQR